MLAILISDNSEFIANYAEVHRPGSKLLTIDNQHLLGADSTEVFYTSLADLPWNQLLSVCLKANEVIFCAPPNWESESLKENTELFLRNLVLHHNVLVKGFADRLDKHNILSLKNTRNTDGNQLWIAGCSYAAGRGLESSQDRYAVHLSKMLQLPYCDLSEVATSIQWSADQILRSDLQPNDIVVWGLTSVNRAAYHTNGQIWFANSRTIENLPAFEKSYFTKLILDDNIVFDAVKTIKQVINVCSKIGCNLVIFSHNGMSIPEHQFILKSYLEVESCFLNISSVDDSAPLSTAHPGPTTNKKWAKEIFDFITTKYCKS